MTGVVTRNPDIVWRDEPAQRDAILRALELGEEAEDKGWVVLVDRGQIHELNLVAGEIWRLADGTRDVPGVAREVAELFDAPFEEILADVQAFLSECADNGWLVREDG